MTAPSFRWHNGRLEYQVYAPRTPENKHRAKHEWQPVLVDGAEVIHLELPEQTPLTAEERETDEAFFWSLFNPQPPENQEASICPTNQR